jgi:hypothetical protein
LPHKILIEGAVSELPKPFGVIGRTLVESSQGNGAILSGLRVRAYGACSKKEYDPFVRLDDGTNFIEQAGYYEYDDKGNLILGPDGNPIWIPPVIGIRAYPLDPTFNFKPFEIFDGISSYLSPGVPVIWEAEPQD